MHAPAPLHPEILEAGFDGRLPAHRRTAHDRRARSAIVCGSAVGGQAAIEAGFQDLWVEGRGRVHPLTIPKTMSNAGASHIAMDLGMSGPTYTVSTACSSANHAIGQAFRLVRD